MEIKKGMTTLIAFCPADEIDDAFKRVNAALGKPDELEELRLFVRVMNYFYEKAERDEDCEISTDGMEEVCRLAKKALNIELGITSKEEGKDEE